MPNYKFSKKTFYFFIFPIVTLSLIFIGNYFIYAWNEPSLNPPNGNLSLPTSAWANIISGGGIYYNGAVRSGDNQAARARLDIGAPANGTSAIFTDNTNSGLRVRHPASNFVGLDVDTNNNLVFTHNNGGTERMRLTSAGNLGIGMIPTERLDVNGNVRATAFLYSSDRNLKTNIRPLENSLDKVLQLRGVNFSWKENNQEDIGVIAQDVEKIYPEAVHTDSNGLKSVDYSLLVAPLIEAIKEQQKEIDYLEQQINKLK